MPDQTAIEQLINTTFATAWTVSPGVYQTPFTVDNVDLASATEWTRLTIEMGVSKQHTLGPSGQRQFERSGLIVVEVHVQRAEGGSRRATALLKIATDAFEAKSMSGLITFAANGRPPTNYGRWYKVAARVPFIYHETK